MRSSARRVMSVPVAVSYGPIPGSTPCAHRFSDLVVHGWDIAQALDLDYEVPADMVDAVAGIIDAERDMLTASGLFGTPQEVGPDESAWTWVSRTGGRGRLNNRVEDRQFPAHRLLECRPGGGHA